MSMLGSALGRGLAGLGSAMSEVGSKYIDQNLAIQRAQALADIQRISAVQQTKDIDTYTNSPERREAMRTQASADTVAAGGAADTVALNRASNQPLTQAEIDRSNAVTTGTAAASAAATGMTERAKAMNQAHDVAPGGQVIVGPGTNDKPTMVDAYREGWRQSNKEARDRLTEATMADLSKQAESLNTIIAKGIADGTLSPELDPDGKNKAQVAAYRELKGQLVAVKLQQQQVRNIAHGGGGDDRDPAGIRGTATSIDEVKAVAAANGDKDYDIQMGGKTVQVRGGKDVAPAPSPASLAATAAQQAAPAPEPAPAGSPQAKHDAAVAAARQAAAEREARDKAATEAARARFDQDASTLKPEDLARKYQDIGARRGLSLQQLSQLRAAESAMMR